MTNREQGYSQDENREEHGRNRGPFAGVNPQGYRRSDDAIFREVCELMAGSGQLSAGEIDVHVENGKVTLSGSVDSVESKRLAEEIAGSAYGVVEVHNQLRMGGTGQIESRGNPQASDGPTD